MWLHHSLFVCCFGSLMRGGWLCLSKTFDLFAWRPWGFFHRWGLMLLLGCVFHLVLQVPSYLLLLLLLSCFSRVRLCDPMDSSPPGSAVSGILQARTLEWVPCPSPPGSRVFCFPVLFSLSPTPVTYVLFLLCLSSIPAASSRILRLFVIFLVISLFLVRSSR